MDYWQKINWSQKEYRSQNKNVLLKLIFHVLKRFAPGLQAHRYSLNVQ